MRTQFLLTLRQASFRGLLCLLTWLAGSQAALAQEPMAPLPQLRLEPGAHWAAVRRVAVSPDRALVATAADDKTVRVWERDTQALVQTLRPPVGDGAAGRLYGVAFHPRLALIAVAGTPVGDRPARIHLFHPQTAEWVRAFDAGPGEVKRLMWSLDGRWLTVAQASPGAVRVYSLEGEPVASVALAGDAYGLDEGPDGAIAATDTAGYVHLFRRSPAGALSPPLSVAAPGGEPIAVAWSPDGQRLAVAHFARDRNGVVDILSGRTGAWLATWRPDSALSGRSQALAWNPAGTAVAVGGVRSDPRATGRDAIESVRGFVQTFDAVSGKALRLHEVASDAVTDLVAVSADSFAFTSFDASWGLIDSRGLLGVQARQADYVRRADRLWLSADGMSVQWQTPSSQGPRSWVLAERRLRQSALPGARAPARPGPFGNSRDWESSSTASPTVQGASMPLAVGEISRAVAGIGRSEDVVWGTGHRLMRVAPGGRILWSVRPGSEVRAVHSSADGRLVVSALADATLRWYRASDGLLLLSLFAPRQDQWVLWSPTGHYDASLGAEQLIGWHLNSAQEAGSEFFSIGRFRSTLLRPDVIDLVLSAADPALALVQADEARAVALARADGLTQVAGSAAATVPAALQHQGIGQRLPPTLVYKQPRAVRTRSATVGLEFGVVLRPGEALTSLVVRRDGVLQEILEQRLPVTADGKTGGYLRIAADEGDSVVHVVAANANGFSDPLTFVLKRETPPVPKVVVRSRLFVLAVGVGAYASKDINGLLLPAKDANDFAEVLAAQDGRAYAKVETRVLTEQAATTEAIKAGLAWLNASVGPGDTGMLFLAGHALNHPDGRYYFVSHNTAPARVAASALNEEAIRSALVGLRGRAVLFVDTCHAGNAIGQGLGFSRDMTRISNQLASPENGVIVFASSTGRQESQENSEWGNGAFTKAVVSGLRGGADFLKRGRVTFQALSLFVSSEVESLTQGEQTPVLIAPPPGLPDFTLAILGAADVGQAAPSAGPGPGPGAIPATPGTQAPAKAPGQSPAPAPALAPTTAPARP